MQKKFEQSNMNTDGIFENVQKKQFDTVQSLERKIYNDIDEKFAELKRFTIDNDKRNTEQIKTDYESLMKLLGASTND